jgi:hypothetical protein
MRLRDPEFEAIRDALDGRGTDRPRTAREILHLLDDHDEDLASAHHVATVLGRHAGRTVEVIEDRPYRYRLCDDPSG